MEFFRFLGLTSVCACLSWGGASLPVKAQNLCRADLPNRINAISTQPNLTSARLGVLVETLGRTEAQRQVLYERDANQYFIPASNMKLLTTAAALQRLGPDFRVRTSVYGNANGGPTALHIVGKGDPTLGNDQLRDLAQQIANQGITQVTNLIGYDGYFPGPAINPNWEWEDIQAGYGAAINGLMWNENELVLTVSPQASGQPLALQWATSLQPWQIENLSRTVGAGASGNVSIWRDFSQPIFRITGQLPANAAPKTFSLAMPNPANFFVQQFQQILAERGVNVLQASVTGQAEPSTTTELATVTSPPMSAWIARTNLRSNNQYAEAILKTLGLANTPNTQDATQAGAEAIKATLRHLGIDPQTYQIADGSGLSRHNLASPATFVDTLQAMAFVSEALTYRSSLAVAGESGTLRNRFRNTPVQGRLQGKTGALSNNASLSGYLDPPNHDPVVISILVNNVDQSSSEIRRIIDAIVLEIAKLSRC